MVVLLLGQATAGGRSSLGRSGHFILDRTPRSDREARGPRRQVESTIRCASIRTGVLESCDNLVIISKARTASTLNRSIKTPLA